jgi:hypothetical protein
VTTSLIDTQDLSAGGYGFMPLSDAATNAVSALDAGCVIVEAECCRQSAAVSPLNRLRDLSRADCRGGFIQCNSQHRASKIAKT